MHIKVYIHSYTFLHITIQTIYSIHTFLCKHEKLVQVNIYFTCIYKYINIYMYIYIYINIHIYIYIKINIYDIYMNYNSKHTKAILHSFQKKKLEMSDFNLLVTK